VGDLINQIQTLLIEFFNRAWKTLGDIQITAIALTIGAMGTKLCGDSFWAVLFLSYAAIFADTATKWVAISKRYYVDTTECLLSEVSGRQVLRGILSEAWGPNHLNSRGLYRIAEKIGMYTLIIAICHAAGKWIPMLDFMGLRFTPATVFPASASIAVFLVELSSINENLKEMGHPGIADMLSKLVSTVASKILPKTGE
jgi:hypothetical protein